MPAIKRIGKLIVILALLCTSCTYKSGRSFVPAIAGYHESKHETFILNKDLLEISGLVHLGDHRFASINDEDGELFFTNMDKDSIVKYRFKGKGDYEDLARVDSTYYVLESTGDIIEIPPPYSKHKTYKSGLKKVEFESLVYYDKENKLVMITKDQKKKASGLTAISFDLSRKEFDPEPFFIISFKEIFTILTNYNMECKPSGAAINPVNNKLYIIASIGKVMLECNRDGKLLKIYKINPTHFAQPEGISFAVNGDMYISNEGADGKATILKFPYSGKN